MPRPEIIDLTDSPVLAATSGPQDVSAKSISTDPSLQADGKTPKKKQRKRKRKQHQGPSAHSQGVIGANRRSDSEEEVAWEEGQLQDTQERQERENRIAKRENDASNLKPQSGHQTPPTKKQKHTEDVSSFLHNTAGNANPEDIFFEDTTPAPLPPNAGNPPPPPLYGALYHIDHNVNDTKLLLPAHVSVLGSTPVEILPPTESDEEDDVNYIKFLDYDGDRQKEFLRYFEEPEDELLKLKRTVCKNCGAEGDHKTADCRVLICLTCGARDEHVTKSCPVSKVCFSCGMKGHINSNCPNRRMPRTRDHSNNGCCNRCHSELHQTSECPTWWRIYVYMSDGDQSRTLNSRRSKRDLELGKGGEGYIAEDEWCYNCGEVGHWGDDCKAAHRWDKPAEPSAFGLHNISTGPFYDPKESRTSSRHERRLRDWECDSGAWNMHAPDGVGRQGRKKMMEKMRRNMRKLEEESDPDDWFGNAGHNDATMGSSRSEQDRDRRRERNTERRRDRDRNQVRGKEEDRERARWQDSARRRGREQERKQGLGRDARDKHRERDRTRDREREQERHIQPERDQNRDQASAINREKAKMNIYFSSASASSKFNPPPGSGLPIRPSIDSPPSLLQRMSDMPIDVQPSSRKNTQGHMSIKGAGRRNGRDDDRRNHRADRHTPGPQYRGGYSR